MNLLNSRLKKIKMKTVLFLKVIAASNQSELIVFNIKSEK